MAFYPSFNLIESIVDEVALEGLDGITLQGSVIIFIHRFYIKVNIKVNCIKIVFFMTRTGELLLIFFLAVIRLSG